MNKSKELVKNTIILFLGKIATQFLTFLLLPLYTGYLNPADYGLIDLILTYITLFVPVIILELDMGIFRYLVDARKDETSKEKILSSSLSLIFILLLIFVIIYLIVVTFLNITFKYLILFDIIVTVLSNVLLQVSRGLGNNIKYSIASFVTGLITVLMSIIFIVGFKLGAVSILYSSIIANLACSLYLFVSLKLKKYVRIKNVDKKINNELLKYSIPLIPNVISWWIVSVSDRTIISYVLGTAANGIYTAAAKFPSILSGFYSVFSLSWTESASLHINDNDRDEFFSNVANSAVKLFSCLSIGLICCIPFIFNIFIKFQYIESYNQIPILILGSFFNCLVMIYSAIYVAKKMTKQVAITSILAAIINIVINIVFVKHIGLYAASISTVIAYLAMTLYRHYDLKKYVNIKYNIKYILFSILGFTLAMISYYIKSNIVHIIALVSIIVITLYVNKNYLVKLKNKILKN